MWVAKVEYQMVVFFEILEREKEEMIVLTCI
jgi:hypothetical protein